MRRGFGTHGSFCATAPKIFPQYNFFVFSPAYCSPITYCSPISPSLATRLAATCATTRINTSSSARQRQSTGCYAGLRFGISCNYAEATLPASRPRRRLACDIAPATRRSG